VTTQKEQHHRYIGLSEFTSKGTQNLKISGNTPYKEVIKKKE
jgi:hypothetical protein